MADSLMQALLGQSAQERLGNDPWFVSGTGLQRQQIQPTSNTEAWLLPALQGLAGGMMQGYGRSNVAQSMASSPLVEALKIDRSTLDTSDPFKVENVLGQALLGNQLKQQQFDQTLKAQQANNDLKVGLLKSLSDSDPDTAAELIKSALGVSKTPIDQSSLATPQESSLQAQPAQSGAFSGNPNSPKYKAAKDVFDAERALSNDFIKNPMIADFKYKEQGLNALVEAFKDQAGTSDFEIVRRTAQMVEPALAVRMDDQQSLERAASITGRTVQEIKALATGETRLTDDARKGMMRIAMRAYNTAFNDYNKTRSSFLERTRAYNLNPSSVVIYDEGKPFNDIYKDLDIGQGSASITPDQYRVLRAQGLSKEEIQLKYGE